MTGQGILATSSPIRDRLLDDHSELEALFAKVLDAFGTHDREGVARLWNEFDSRVTKHLEAEDRSIIPQLYASRPRAARAIIEEHRHIRSRLVELGCGVRLHTIPLKTVRGFVDELRAHARHEEAVLYVWADENVSEAGRDALLSAMAVEGPE